MASLTINVARDTRVDSATANHATNFGTSTNISASGDTATALGRIRALMAFDLSALPANATITALSFKAAPNTVVGTTTAFDLYDLITNYDWTELGATYDTKDGTHAWAGGASGCSTHGTDISSTPLGTLNTTSGDAADVYETCSLSTTLAQSVYAGTGQNGDKVLHLCMVRQGASSSVAVTFRSLDSTANKPAQLVITYTTTNTRTSVATAALSSAGLTRASVATAAVKSTLTRTSTATAALSGTASRSSVATAALSSTGTTRTSVTTAALSTTGSTRTSTATAALTQQFSRATTADAALSGTPNRSSAATAALSSLGLTRASTATAALTTLGLTRATTATTALSNTLTRTSVATGALSRTGNTRTSVATAALADAVTPGTLTVNDIGVNLVQLTASFTGDVDNTRVVTFGYSTDNATWTDFSDPVTYTNGASATAICTGLAGGTAYYFRATFANSGGLVTGTNPILVGGGTPSTTSTQAANVLRHGTRTYTLPNFFNYTAPNSGTSVSDTAGTTVALADLIILKHPGADAFWVNGNTAYNGIRDVYATKPDAFVGWYTLRSEVRHDGIAPYNPVTRADESWCFDDTARDDLKALLATDETVVLHQSGFTDSAHRFVTTTTTSGKLYLNLANASVQAFIARTARRMFLTAQKAARTTGKLYFIFLDNTDTSVRAATQEYGAAQTFSSTWDTGGKAVQDDLLSIGVPVIGNLFSQGASTAQRDSLGAHLSGSMIETAYGGFGGPTNTAATMHSNLQRIESYRDRTANSGTFPSNYVVLAVGGIADPLVGGVPTSNATYFTSANSAIIEHQGACHWLVTDGHYVLGRSADTTSGGYARIRERDSVWLLNPGTPQGSRSFLSGQTGSPSSPDGIWERRFALGTLYVNFSASSRTHTATGTLAPAATTGSWLWVPGARVAVATAALSTPGLTRTAIATAALSQAFSRTGTATAALSQAGNARTAAATVAIMSTAQRAASADAALSVTAARTTLTDAALALAGNTRAAVADAALSATATLTRTSVADAALTTLGLTRAASADAALQTTASRTASASAALATLGVTRSAAASAALAALGVARTTLATAALLASPARTADATAALNGTATRSAVADAALSLPGTFERDTVAQAVLSAAGVTRVSTASAALSVLAQTRATLATAALSAASVSRTSVGTAALTQTGQTRAALATAALTLPQTLTRTASATGALSSAGNQRSAAALAALASVDLTRATLASAALGQTFTRTTTTDAALAATETRSAAAMAVLSLPHSRSAVATAAIGRSEVRVILIAGADDARITIAGTLDRYTLIRGVVAMPTRTPLTIYLDSDTVVRMTIAGGDDITGQTFAATLKDARALSGAVLATGTTAIADPAAGIVDWILAPADTANIKAGTHYQFDIWRIDDGSNIPLAYGPVTLVRLPSS